MAAAGHPEDKQSLSNPNSFKYRGKITLVDSGEILDRAARFISAEKVLGFDVETKPSFKKGEVHPPALMQIATFKEVFLIRLLKFDWFEILKPVLESETTIKAGIGILDDVRKLLSAGRFLPAGFVEIGQLARKTGCQKSSLKYLAKEIMGLEISKKSRLTNWEKTVLTEDQIAYAAADAYLSRELFLRLRVKYREAFDEPVIFCKFPSEPLLQGRGPS